MNGKPAATAVAAGLCLLTACAGDSEVPADSPEWRGSITTEGTVTTVRNESGSVWEGVGTLVEEASIGVEAGADLIHEVNGGRRVSAGHFFWAVRESRDIRSNLDGHHSGRG